MYPKSYLNIFLDNLSNRPTKPETIDRSKQLTYIEY